LTIVDRIVPEDPELQLDLRAALVPGVMLLVEFETPVPPGTSPR